MRRYFLEKTVFILIFLISVFFRFYNLNWDENFHLHPDERFLIMVGNALKLPNNLNDYFNQKTSLMNPRNVGYPFFVYGNFPLNLNKVLAVKLNLDNYNDFTLLGRGLSAFFDSLVIILIFKTCLLLFPNKKIIGFFSSLIYGLSVLPIQLSHFFAVDSFLNFFMFASFYFSLKFLFLKKNKFIYLVFSSLLFSMALGSKITAIFLLPLLILSFFLMRTDLLWKPVLFLILTYFFLRLVNPYYFENINFFDSRLSSQFLKNINELKYLTVKSLDNWYPPMVQWLSKNPLTHSLINNIVIGFGAASSLFFLVGVIYFLKKYLKDFKNKKNTKVDNLLLVVFFWFLGVFLYQSFQVNPTLRYFIFLYPFASIFAGYGLYYLFKLIFHQKNKRLKYYFLRFMFHVLCFIFFLWPLMFISIYTNRHSRVVASEWIYKNLPNQSVILGEEWDDPLPLWVSKTYGKNFQTELLPVFWSDSKEKWEKMMSLLDKADYYVMSSNRGWGSIPTVPKKYPIMSEFYDKILRDECFIDEFFNKKICFKKIKEFTSYPSLYIPILDSKIYFNDQWADEGFTVYDHPKVIVFKKI